MQETNWANLPVIGRFDVFNVGFMAAANFAKHIHFSMKDMNKADFQAYEATIIRDLAGRVLNEQTLRHSDFTPAIGGDNFTNFELLTTLVCFPNKTTYYDANDVKLKTPPIDWLLPL